MRNHKLLIFSSLIVLFVSCNNTRRKMSINGNQKLGNIVIAEDSVPAKDFKVLLAFADTLFINRYSSEIESFRKDDSLNPTRSVDVVFTGSSSIRKWTSLKNDMQGCKILNRGFGGSTIPEVIYYSNILIFKHHPEKIVFYAGENDISDTNTNANKVVKSFQIFQKLVELQLPQSQIYFVSVKPSPARWAWWPEMQLINKKIKLFCDSTENCSFIDVSSVMLNKNGLVRKDIFVTDKLHLNKKGYQIWAEIIQAALKCKINKGL